LVSRRGPREGRCRVLCGHAAFLCHWLTSRGLAARPLLARSARLAVALHPGRNPSGPIGLDHSGLPNGLATSSEVAFRRGTRVDYGATRPGEESEARRSYLQHLASFPSPRRHSAHVLLFFRDVWKLRNRVLASHHAE